MNPLTKSYAEEDEPAAAEGDDDDEDEVAVSKEKSIRAIFKGSSFMRLFPFEAVSGVCRDVLYLLAVLFDNN